jgi:hypothetical protein
MGATGRWRERTVRASAAVQRITKTRAKVSQKCDEKRKREGERGIKELKKAVLWIRIRIRIGNPDPNSGGLKLPTKVKKIQVGRSARC